MHYDGTVVMTSIMAIISAFQWRLLQTTKSHFWITCTQSAITISALRVLQSCAATADFPTEVAPAITITCFPSSELGRSRLTLPSARFIFKLLLGWKWRLVTALETTKSAKRMQWNIHKARRCSSFSLRYIRPLTNQFRWSCHQHTLANWLMKGSASSSALFHLHSSLLTNLYFMA